MRINRLVTPVLLTAAIAAGVAASSACAYVFGGPKKTLDEVLALPAADFRFGVSEYARDAIEKNDKSALPGLWRLFDRAFKERQPDGYPSELSSVTQAIGLLGSDADLVRLLPYYDSEKRDYVRFNVFLVPMSNIYVRRELQQALSGAPLNPLPLDPAAGPPVTATDASPDLRNACLQYDTIRRRFEPLNSSRTSPVATRKGELDGLFWTIGSLLRGNIEGITDRLGGFYWASGCGTFSDSLEGPKYLGMFMSLLKERRYHEALGALLAFERESNHIPGPTAAEAEFEWQRRFIAFCGYDWEDLYAAAAVQNRGSAGSQLVRLVDFGSDRGAKYVAELLGSAGSGYARSGYVHAAAQFIAPGPNVQAAGSRIYSFTFRRSGPPASGPVQDKLLKLITSLVSPQMDKETADACASVLSNLCRPETVDALRTLLALPYEKYRPQLVRALKALGETVEVAPPSGPVRFRLLDHGAPLAGIDTGIELCYEGSGSHLSTSRTSDNDGVVSLDRDFFVDPQNPISAVVFRTRGRLWDGRVHPEDPVLALWQPTPNDLAALTEVDIDFARLTINFRFADRADLQWSFVLDESRGPKSVIPYSPALGRDLPPSGQIVFPKVARGAYVLKVRKKTKLLVSTTFDMAGQDQTIDLSEP